MVDIALLLVFGASSKEDHDLKACNRVIHAVAWTIINHPLVDAAAYGLVYAKIALLSTVNPGHDLEDCLSVADRIKPSLVDVNAIGR
ncbi:hypothetical protein D3C84_1143160 [compost metagenome]